MRLKPAEERALLAGEPIDIVRDQEEQPCRLDLRTTKAMDGTKIPTFSVQFTSSTRLKTGKWLINKTIIDNRALYLDGAGGYTRSPARSIDPEAAVIDPETLKRYAASSRLSQAERTKASPTERKRQEKRIQSVLREAVKELGPEAGTELLARIERTIKEATVGGDT